MPMLRFYRGKLQQKFEPVVSYKSENHLQRENLQLKINHLRFQEG